MGAADILPNIFSLYIAEPQTYFILTLCLIYSAWRGLKEVSHERIVTPEIDSTNTTNSVSFTYQYCFF